MSRAEKILSEISGYESPELKERQTEPIIQPYDCLEAMHQYLTDYVRWRDGNYEPAADDGHIGEYWKGRKYYTEGALIEIFNQNQKEK